MIELTNSEIKSVPGGLYYTCLGTTIGALAVAGWAISMAGAEGLSKSNRPFTLNFVVFCGTIGAMFGSVVGLCID